MEENISISRRQFIRGASVIGAGLGLAVACSPAAPVVGPTPTMDHTEDNAQPQQQTDDMDKLHAAGVKAFLDNAGKHPEFWGTKLDYKLDGDVKVFELTCKEVDWEVQPGTIIKAMTYNGIVPGPFIRVTEGDKIRINVKNVMSQSTAVHFHGLHMPNKMDGVPFITQEPIKPGGTFTYEFVAKPAGTHMYHSHHNAAEQVTKGLLAACIVDPKDTSKEPQVDQEYLMVLNDTGIGLTINGKSFPATQPLTAKVGQKIRIRYMNEGLLIHPMHLHGMYQTVIAKDGAMLPAPYLADTLTVGPGERFDVIVDCQEPGAWAFHCHILTHAESQHGMFGMVTALIIS